MVVSTAVVLIVVVLSATRGVDERGGFTEVLLFGSTELGDVLLLEGLVGDVLVLVD